MTNTHYAAVTSSVPPTLELIACGPADFCSESLTLWIADHPLGEYQEGEVLSRLGRTDVLTERLMFHLKSDPIPFGDLAKRFDEEGAEVRAGLVRLEREGRAKVIYGQGWCLA
jgi:hypothetical protein